MARPLDRLVVASVAVAEEIRGVQVLVLGEPSWIGQCRRHCRLHQQVARLSDCWLVVALVAAVVAVTVVAVAETRGFRVVLDEPSWFVR